MCVFLKLLSYITKHSHKQPKFDPRSVQIYLRLASTNIKIGSALNLPSEAFIGSINSKLYFLETIVQKYYLE